MRIQFTETSDADTMIELASDDETDDVGGTSANDLKMADEAIFDEGIEMTSTHYYGQLQETFVRGVVRTVKPNGDIIEGTYFEYDEYERPSYW